MTFRYIQGRILALLLQTVLRNASTVLYTAKPEVRRLASLIRSIKIMNEPIELEERSDSIADAIAAVALIAIFVITCIFWVSGQ